MAEIRGYKEFYAICNHMQGSERALRVGGTVTLSTGGGSAKLGNPKSGGINPDLLELDLTVTPGQAGPDVISDVKIEEFCDENPSTEFKEVYFHLVDRDEEPPQAIEVEHPQ